ncbi:DNA-binding protein (Roi) [Acinetobacter baumannii]|nr:DNA-binding protein (Roi) [Acinetobacter baumannii]
MIEDRVERAKKWIEEETAKQAIEIKLIEAKQVIEVIQPKADVYDIISNSSNTYTIRDTAKLLKMRPKDLTDWLQANGWIYGKSSASYRPFAAHDRNHLKLVASNYGTQVRVTGKGLVWLARKLKVELDSIDFE